MRCFEMWLQVKESAEGKGYAWTQKVLTELSGKGRSESVECEHDGERQSGKLSVVR